MYYQTPNTVPQGNQPIEEEQPQMLEDVAGVVTYKSGVRVSSNNKPFCSIKVGNAFYTIWSASEYNNFNQGDYIRASFTRKYGPKGDFLTIQKVYQIKQAQQSQPQPMPGQIQQPIQTQQPAAQPMQPVQPVTSEAEKYDLGMAINGAVSIIAECSHDFADALTKLQNGDYERLVEGLFNKNKELRMRFLQ